MARDPNVPAAFDVYTLVILRRPPNPPAMSDDELGSLQSQHLAYRAELGRQGVLVVNGPLLEQSDPTLRGDVMEWWVGADRLAFPLAGGIVGRRASMGG